MLIRLRKDLGKMIHREHCIESTPVRDGCSRPQASAWAGRVIEVEPETYVGFRWVCGTPCLFRVVDERLISSVQGNACLCIHYLQPDEKFDEAQGDESAPVSEYKSWTDDLERRAEMVTVSSRG